MFQPPTPPSVRKPQLRKIFTSISIMLLLLLVIVLLFVVNGRGDPLSAHSDTIPFTNPSPRSTADVGKGTQHNSDNGETNKRDQSATSNSGGSSSSGGDQGTNNSGHTASGGDQGTNSGGHTASGGGQGNDHYDDLDPKDFVINTGEMNQYWVYIGNSTVYTDRGDITSILNFGILNYHNENWPLQWSAQLDSDCSNWLTLVRSKGYFKVPSKTDTDSNLDAQIQESAVRKLKKDPPTCTVEAQGIAVDDKGIKYRAKATHQLALHIITPTTVYSIDPSQESPGNPKVVKITGSGLTPVTEVYFGDNKAEIVSNPKDDKTLYVMPPAPSSNTKSVPITFKVTYPGTAGYSRSYSPNTSISTGQQFMYQSQVISTPQQQAGPTSQQAPLTQCITLNSNSLSFTGDNGYKGYNPTAQQLTVTNCGSSGTVSTTISTDSASWLAVSGGGQVGANNQTSINVSVNALNSGLSPGQYSGTITITIKTSDGNTKSAPVNVSFNLTHTTAPAPTPTLSPQPTLPPVVQPTPTLSPQSTQTPNKKKI